MKDNKYLTVEALTKYLKYRFDHDKNLENVYLKGEVSNYKKNLRGHLYFTLKDDKAQISCIMFASSTNQLKFDVREGMKVLVCGKVTIYEQSGTYQIYLTEIKEDGIGDLYIAYLQLKEKLEKEGYFDVSHKKPIPKFPKRIGVITSSTGAVIQDIIHTVNRRYRNCEIILYPTIVQGDSSHNDLIEKVKEANRDQLVDVLIIGRGGGSIEDLWGFNDEQLCKTIYHSTIPIISAVGHETDYTICDFVCDYRAPTPTAAAEIATPNTEDLLDTLYSHTNKLNVYIKNILEQKKTELIFIDRVLDKSSPKNNIENYYQILNNFITHLNKNIENIYIEKKNAFQLINQKFLSTDLMGNILKQKEKVEYVNNSLINTMKNILSNKISQYDLLNQKLKTLNPLFIMEKGFSIVYKEDKLIKSIKDVNINDELKVSVNDGNIKVIVKEKEEKNGK